MERYGYWVYNEDRRNMVTGNKNSKLFRQFASCFSIITLDLYYWFFVIIVFNVIIINLINLFVF